MWRVMKLCGVLGSSNWAAFATAPELIGARPNHSKTIHIITKQLPHINIKREPSRVAVRGIKLVRL